MKRRSFLLASVGVGLAGLASACSKKPTDSSPGSELIVGLTYIPDIQFAPFYVGEKKNFFSDAGLNLKLRHHGQQETLMGALQSGNEHIVFAGGDEMVHARSQNIDVINFATMYQEYPIVLITPKNSPINSFADLRGHSVGLPGPFGENWYGLLAMLEQAGLEQKDVNIQNIGYTQQAALQSGQVDAVIGFINNDVVRFQTAGFEVKTFGLGKDATLVGVGLGGLTKTVNERSPELSKMLTALRRSMDYINANIDETVQITTEYVSSLTTPEQKDQAKKILIETMKLYAEPERAGRQNVDSWNKITEFMFDKKLVERKVSPEDVFTTMVVDNASI